MKLYTKPNIYYIDVFKDRNKMPTNTYLSNLLAYLRLCKPPVVANTNITTLITGKTRAVASNTIAAQGHVCFTKYFHNSKLDENFILLSSKVSDCYEILHMAWQLCCHGKCKIAKFCNDMIP